MAARLMDRVGVAGVAVGQGAEQALTHDVGEADHGVQRGAQLVAHIGQEAGLAGALGLGLGAGALQAQFTGELGGAVEGLGDQARRVASGIAAGILAVVEPPQDHDDAPVQGLAGAEQDLGRLAGGGPLKRGGDGGAVGGVDGGDQALVHQGVDGDRRRRRAPGGDGAAGRIEQQGQAGLGVQHRLDPAAVRLGEGQAFAALVPGQADGRGGGRHGQQAGDGGQDRRLGLGAVQQRRNQARNQRQDQGGDPQPGQTVVADPRVVQHDARGQGHDQQAGHRPGRPAGQAGRRHRRQQPASHQDESQADGIAHHQHHPADAGQGRQQQGGQHIVRQSAEALGRKGGHAGRHRPAGVPQGQQR